MKKKDQIGKLLFCKSSSNIINGQLDDACWTSRQILPTRQFSTKAKSTNPTESSFSTHLRKERVVSKLQSIYKKCISTHEASLISNY